MPDNDTLRERLLGRLITTLVTAGAGRAAAEYADALLPVVAAEVEVARGDAVTPAEISRQRAKGWPDFDAEDYCHRCGRPNPSWFADSTTWNEAGTDRAAIICPPCFEADHRATVGDWTTWRFAPMENSDQVGTLVRSEAEMRHDRDAAREALAAQTAEIEALCETVAEDLAETDGFPRHVALVEVGDLDRILADTGHEALNLLLEQAWDEGWQAGDADATESHAARMGNVHGPTETPNPYATRRRLPND